MIANIDNKGIKHIFNTQVERNGKFFADSNGCRYFIYDYEVPTEEAGCEIEPIVFAMGDETELKLMTRDDAIVFIMMDSWNDAHDLGACRSSMRTWYENKKERFIDNAEFLDD